MKTVVLQKGKERSLLRRHPWVFSGAILRFEPSEPEEGELVTVNMVNGNTIGVGYYQHSSIAVKMLLFGAAQLPTNFWQTSIFQAFNARKNLGLTESDVTNCYRLVHGEGDNLPGLIIDVYNNHAVIQCHSWGMYLHKEEIQNALITTFGDRLKSIYDKSAETLPQYSGLKAENGCLWGEDVDSTIVLESQNKFEINWKTGQKTGFFIDQRENRKLLADISKGKSVLNTFCYSGGFSVAAINAGAEYVHSVDSSSKAIDLTKTNLQLNNASETANTCFAQDTLHFLKSSSENYDIVILDPPAYAKNQRVKHNAVQGYKRLNFEGIKKVKPGGLLFTFSCSQAIDRQLFYDTVVAACIESGRSGKVLYHLSQPADHPVNIFHPEGAYLKGLVLQID